MIKEFVTIYNSLINLSRNINIFYSILGKIEKWNKLDNDKKGEILAFYYKLKDNHLKIINYFNDFEVYLSKTPLKSFTKGVINHKF